MSTSHLPGNAAPLPSPTSRATDSANYFSTIPPHSVQTEAHPHFNQQAQLQLQQHQHQQHYPQKPQSSQLPMSQQQEQVPIGAPEPVRQNSSSSSGSETSLHLFNSTLLQEAAGRAMVDCTTRDIEEMQL